MGKRNPTKCPKRRGGERRGSHVSKYMNDAAAAAMQSERLKKAKADGRPGQEYFLPAELEERIEVFHEGGKRLWRGMKTGREYTMIWDGDEKRYYPVDETS